MKLSFNQPFNKFSIILSVFPCFMCCVVTGARRLKNTQWNHSFLFPTKISFLCLLWVVVENNESIKMFYFLLNLIYNACFPFFLLLNEFLYFYIIHKTSELLNTEIVTNKSWQLCAWTFNWRIILNVKQEPIAFHFHHAQSICMQILITINGRLILYFTFCSSYLFRMTPVLKCCSFLHWV